MDKDDQAENKSEVLSIEERLAQVESKLFLIDEALGAVVSFVREHGHDKTGNAYIPQRL